MVVKSLICVAGSKEKRNETTKPLLGFLSSWQAAEARRRLLERLKIDGNDKMGERVPKEARNGAFT